MIRVVEETLRVEKRQVESGRVRVHVRTDEHDETVETLLASRDLSVERVTVGRPITEMPQSRVDGDILIVPIVEEVVVVEKRLVLKEELHIRLNRTEHVDRQTVRLRREHAEIDLDGTAVDLTNTQQIPPRSVS